MKVDEGDNVVAFCVDRLSPVVSVLPVVYGRSVVITGIAPNVSAGFRKPRKRERSYLLLDVFSQNLTPVWIKSAPH